MNTSSKSLPYARAFYQLLHELKEEAVFVNVQVKLVSDGKLQRKRTDKYRNVDARLQSYWTEYARDAPTHGL